MNESISKLTFLQHPQRQRGSNQIISVPTMSPLYIVLMAQWQLQDFLRLGYDSWYAMFSLAA